VPRAEQYRELLASADITDVEFESVLQGCRMGVEESQRAAKLAIQKRQRIIIVVSLACVAVLIVVAGVSIQRQQRQTAITDAALEVARVEAARVAEADAERVVEAARVAELKRLEAAPVEALQAWADDLGVPVESTNSIGMKLKLIPPGEFMMGSNSSRGDLETAGFVLPDDFDNNDEQPAHRVRITNPFYMGIHEVTRGQFAAFVNDTGYQTEAEKDGKGGYGFDAAGNGAQKPEYNWKHNGMSQTDSHPVVNVSWNDTVEFIQWLSKKEGKQYRLPTEAEWEYSCRAGSETHFSSGDSLASLKGFGNMLDASYKGQYTNDYKLFQPFPFDDGFVYTSPVGQFKANKFGLYDMHGNVWEWCSDWYGPDYYATSPLADPAGATSGLGRVLRGGSWWLSARVCRSVSREDFGPSFRSRDLGFRLALSPSGQ
jgi:sulfatase modifying factor 1